MSLMRTMRQPLSFFGRQGSFAKRLQRDASKLASWGKIECSTCPASPFSASIRHATPAATGCAPTPPALSATTAAAPAAATCFATFLHLSAHASACGPALSPRTRSFAPAPASSPHPFRSPRRPFQGFRLMFLRVPKGVGVNASFGSIHLMPGVCFCSCPRG